MIIRTTFMLSFARSPAVRPKNVGPCAVTIVGGVGVDTISPVKR